MERINLAELLKDCPKGMKLYSPIFGDVYLDKIRPHLAIVVTIDKEQSDLKEEFLYDGRYGINGECMLFPSKGKTTWEGFVPPCQFNDGDIAISDKGDIHLLRTKDSSYCAYRVLWRGLAQFDETPTTSVRVVRLATEEEKDKLFQAIKDNGYKWNEETKTLEKLIDSKEDTEDKTVMSGIYFDREYYADEVELHLNNYEIEIRDGKTYAIFKNQETKTLKPEFKIGDRIRQKTDLWPSYRTIKSYDKNIGYSTTINDWVRLEDQDNWELVPNKFDITILKPFDKVLVRDFDNTPWEIEFFSRLLDGKHFKCFELSYVQCIPYEGNEHLLGKKDDCDEFYRTWEKTGD